MSRVLARIGGFDRTILATRLVGRNVSADCAWLVVFDGEPPTLAELRGHVAERIGGAPPLQLRLAHPALRLGCPYLVPDPDFSVERRVHRAPPAYDDDSRWLDFVGDLLTRSVADALPPWSLYLAHGDGCFAFVLRHDHVLADGQSGFAILRTLLAGAPPHRCGRGRGPGPLRLSALAARDSAAHLRELAAAGRHEAERGRIGAQASAALGSVVRWARGPRPPRLIELNGTHGPTRRVASLAIPLSDLRPVVAAAGCFPNEIYLTIVAGALRRYLARRGVDVDSSPDLQVGTMLDVGGRRDPARLGNHYAAVRIGLNLSERDERARLERVCAARRELHASGDVEGSWATVQTMAWLPSPFVGVTAWVLTSPRATINTIASHMSGWRTVTFRGEHPRRLCSWTYMPGGHGISFVCQLGRAELTINVMTDPAIVPDLDAAMDALRTAHHDLVAAFATPERSS